MVFENRFPSFAENADRLREARATRRPRPLRGVCFTSDHDAPAEPPPPSASGSSSTPGSTAPPRWPSCRRSSRCSASRTAARRSGSRSATRTGRSTAIRSSRHAPQRCSSPPARYRRAHRTGRLRRPARAAELARRQPRRRQQRALGGVRAVRGPLAGRGAPLPATARSPTCPSLGEPRATTSPAIYLDAAAARWTRLYDAPLPYISGWHQAPVRVDRDLASLHLEVFSIKRAAGQAQVPGRLRVRAWAHSSTTSLRSGPPRCCATRCRDDAGARVGRGRLRGVRRARARGRLVVPRPGQPDRRAHRLQRRLRAAVRDRGPGLGRGGAARSDGVLRMRSVQQPARRRDGRPRRAGARARPAAGRRTSPASSGRRARPGTMSAAWTCWSTAGCRSAAGSRRRTRWSARSHGRSPTCTASASARTSWPRLSLVAENDFVGAPTGMMDQLASLRCTAGHALFLDNRDLSTSTRCPSTRPPPACGCSSWTPACTTSTPTSGYGDRRASCERAAKILGVTALRDVTVGGLDVCAGPTARRRAAPPGAACRHRRTRGWSTPRPRCGRPTGRCWAR